MSTKILMRYKRVDECYAGELQVNGAVVDLFENVSFAQQTRLLHLLLVKHPDAVVEMQRTDHDGLMPFFLEPHMVQLIIDDPLKYIQAHTIPHRTVDLRKTGRTSKLAAKHVVPQATTVRAGHATLADTFGDVLYLNFRNGRVEDPVTGRWRPWPDVMAELGLTVLETIVTDASTSGQYSGGWITVRTSELLKNNVLGFYLPRAWNEDGPWIKYEALAEEYNQYLKERASCLETTKTP